MMKNNLGKIVFILSLVVLPLILNAKVLLKAPDTFYKDDIVMISIIALGSEVSIPEIKSIDGNIVQEGGTSQQTTIVNGKRSYQIEKKYLFKANKEIHIPSFKIMVDDKIEITQAKTIKLLKVEKTKSNLYDLSISVDKNEVYVGEAIEFTLKFKYKKNLEIVNLDYKKPTFENFWVKELKPQEKQDNFIEYVEQEIKYLLFPQKEGIVDLDAVRIDVVTVKNNYNGGFYLSTPTVSTPVYSNKLKLNIKALPQGINLIGDFKIKSTIDKTAVKQGEAVSFKLYVDGRGNIDDLDEIALKIPSATIYDNPAKKEYDLKNNLYGGSYSKIYSIVAKNDFTIPSVEIKYFDPNTKQIKIVKTKSYDIKVEAIEVKNSTLEVQEVKKVVKEKVTVVKIDQNEKILYFIIGLCSGIFVVIIYLLIKNRKKTKTETPLIKLVKKSKSPDELFKVLVVYINIDEELDKIIYKLENLSFSEYKEEKKNILKTLNELEKKDIKLDI